jgi:hypothetical protein
MGHSRLVGAAILVIQLAITSIATAAMPNAEEAYAAVSARGSRANAQAACTAGANARNLHGIKRRNFEVRCMRRRGFPRTA